MNRDNIIKWVAGGALAVLTATALTGWQAERRRASGLESQLAELREQEKRSAVVRSVSKQMEEIAYQQKVVSDEQRVEAQQQTILANEERLKAEASERQAKASEQRARASEQQAQEARLVAENQRLAAEHQRHEAELSRSQADTLRYRALGRSLGSLSTTHALSGNKELGDLLAYAAYLYTSRYGGDVYNTAVLKSLTVASQSKRSWAVHDGAVMAIDFMPGSDDDLVSVSSYGEVIRHKRVGSELQSTVLLKDSHYDFRSVFITDKNTIFAVSRSGHLLVIPQRGPQQIIAVSGVTRPCELSTINSDLMAVIGEESITYMDMHTYKQLGTQKLGFKVTATGRANTHPLLFDDRGRMHEVTDFEKITTSKVPVKGHVTAFAESKTTGFNAYGMMDGTIYVFNAKGQQKKLVGHRSRVSRLKFNGPRLYSSSYDGTINHWLLSEEKTDPMPLLSTDGWIMYFTRDHSKNYIWTGDQYGTLTESLISIPVMVSRIKKQLKRDLTQEEWNYYIGNNVPRESFVNDKKGGRP